VGLRSNLVPIAIPCERDLDAKKSVRAALCQKEVLRDTAMDDRTARAMADGDPARAPGNLGALPPARRGQCHRAPLPLAGLHLRHLPPFGSAPRASEARPVA